MSNEIAIRSSNGIYVVDCRSSNVSSEPAFLQGKNYFVLIDKYVHDLHGPNLTWLKKSVGTLRIEALESNKDLNSLSSTIEGLVKLGIRRGDLIVAIGGGIIQDIACFLSTVLFRGIDWAFCPTTLLAQADSCVGSKSSINVNGIKNLVGSFSAPVGIDIRTDFLLTLKLAEINSGLGEILKIALIADSTLAEDLSKNIENLQENWSLCAPYIKRSLEIKKTFVEQDEFDQNSRLVLNYGHTFGHAIETASNYEIPHGIAVAMGVDMANYVSTQIEIGNIKFFEKWHALAQKIYGDFNRAEVPLAKFFDAISKDKKNTSGFLTLILPDQFGKITRVKYARDKKFEDACASFLNSVKNG